MLKSFYTRTSRAENFITMLLSSAKVSSQVFVSHLPITMKQEWNDLVLVDLVKGMDKGSHYLFTVNIYLYARPTGSLQMKNVKVIDAMEEKLRDGIANSANKHYDIGIEWSDTGYDSSINFHYNVVSCYVKAHE